MTERLGQGMQHPDSRFPSIETMSRRAAENTDIRRKLRYFRQLLIKLDAEIGQRKQTFNELMHAGELVDPEVPQLQIERLELLRNHAARHLESISLDPFADTQNNGIRDSPPESHALNIVPDAIEGDDDDLLTTKELADLLRLSQSWVEHNTTSRSIPHIRIGRAVRFRRGDIKAWILEQRQDIL